MWTECWCALQLQDPMADPGERALAQELRGIGLVAYEVPEWKTKVRVCVCLVLEMFDFTPKFYGSSNS